MLILKIYMQLITRWICSMTRRRPSIQLISLSEQSDLNPHLRSIRVVRGKIETPSTQAEIGSHLSSDGEADGKVDTIVSEPIGVLLFHERMVSLAQSTLCDPPVVSNRTDVLWLKLTWTLSTGGIFPDGP